jgi:hypothetical protein
MAGYLALYEIGAVGNLTRIYPASGPAAPVAPGRAIEIPDSPIKMAAASHRLRLVVVPANSRVVAGQSGGSAGTVGGLVNGVVNKELLLQAPANPLVVDIPLAPN